LEKKPYPRKAGCLGIVIFSLPRELAVPKFARGDAAKAFLVKSGSDFDFVVGEPESVCARLMRFGVDVTVPRGPLVDHAARAGAVAIFRYLATSTDRFSLATMSAAFAGGVGDQQAGGGLNRFRAGDGC
jgi:hypothetical protein